MAETSKTVDQAMRLLVSLRRDGPASTTALARRLHTSRTVVSRLTTTLERHGLVRRTADGFDLGFGLIDLADGLAPDLRATARPHLETLAAELRETVVLAVVDGDDAVALDQVVPGGRLVRIHYHAGSRHSLAEAAHGKAMLASAPAGVIDRLTAVHDDPEALRTDLAAVRTAGFAVTHDELEEGVSGIAAAVTGTDGITVASVGMVAPTARFPRPDDIGPLVVAAASSIATDLMPLAQTATG